MLQILDTRSTPAIHGSPAVTAPPRARAGLMSLATAVPAHRLPQQDVAAAMHHVFADIFARSETMAGIFAATGIRQRYTARPLDWYLEPQGWPERSAVYTEVGGDLFVEVADRALEAAGCTAGEVDAVVFVSSSGIATPSLDAVVHHRMGFRPDIERVPVFGLGCAGGVTGLAVAARIAEAQPGATVLMVTVELSSLAFRLDRPDKTSLISSALFGDGAAAIVLRAGEQGIAVIEGAGEHLWPDTLGIMGWSIDPVGFGVILVPDVPTFARANLRPAVAGILARMGLSTADIGRFVCHPGGAKVITAIEHSFELEQGALDHERGVLADYGNMSAPTVLFILDRVLHEGLPDRATLVSMGPGFTASCVSLARAW
ncbi:alkylresorcinol/alkylpyrone synthase [Ancylobacter sp. 3268]|uniref:type III polyketide synthase n=1 Tax=Ancylobacter sp. 3268 TaxID=2817752 RepID=UPI00286064C4|nr:type III polyketide synthase [Ancylobacter sp. 3268]MDR6953210.1 alkylresorcinol/alkylpyrone synthase [Ancylobacter sp. 3268]